MKMIELERRGHCVLRYHPGTDTLLYQARRQVGPGEFEPVRRVVDVQQALEAVDWLSDLELEAVLDRMAAARSSYLNGPPAAKKKPPPKKKAAPKGK